MDEACALNCTMFDFMHDMVKITNLSIAPMPAADLTNFHTYFHGASHKKAPA